MRRDTDAQLSGWIFCVDLDGDGIQDAGTEPTGHHRRQRPGRLQPDPGRQLLDLRGRSRPTGSTPIRARSAPPCETTGTLASG